MAWYLYFGLVSGSGLRLEVDWDWTDLRPFSNRPLAIVDAIEVVSLHSGMRMLP
jgi:hypothetical protein